MPLDVLDHDDGVIDDDTNREHQAEQGEVVDREVQHCHHRQGTDQRDRYGDDRDNRGPPTLQKHQHDDDDQDHRLVDGLDQLGDRLGDELGRVIADVVLEAFRETPLQVLYGFGNALGGGKCVRARALKHHERYRGFPAEKAVGGEIQRAEFDPNNVAQAHDATVLAVFDDDILELGGVLQSPGKGQFRLESPVG